MLLLPHTCHVCCIGVYFKLREIISEPIQIQFIVFLCVINFTCTLNHNVNKRPNYRI
jgi:hypothetical protein